MTTRFARSVPSPSRRVKQPSTAETSSTGAFVRNSGYLLKWLILGVAIGIIAGLGAVLFYLALDYTGQFLLGYLTLWTGFSALATLAQWGLLTAALVSPMMESTSKALGGGLLLGAGLFQFSRLKYACLAHCRSPMGFLATEWRDGSWGAFRMGLKHGGYCLGCCWALMGLLFAFGVMNLLWVAGISGFVLLEKIISANQLISPLAVFCSLAGQHGLFLARKLV